MRTTILRSDRMNDDHPPDYLCRASSLRALVAFLVLIPIYQTRSFGYEPTNDRHMSSLPLWLNMSFLTTSLPPSQAVNFSIPSYDPWIVLWWMRQTNSDTVNYFILTSYCLCSICAIERRANYTLEKQSSASCQTIPATKVMISDLSRP